MTPCALVPPGVFMPLSFDGKCPSCGNLFSAHPGVTIAITGRDLGDESDHEETSD